MSNPQNPYNPGQQETLLKHPRYIWAVDGGRYLIEINAQRLQVSKLTDAGGHYQRVIEWRVQEAERARFARGEVVADKDGITVVVNTTVKSPL